MIFFSMSLLFFLYSDNFYTATMEFTLHSITFLFMFIASIFKDVNSINFTQFTKNKNEDKLIDENIWISVSLFFKLPSKNYI